jgi:hypothetical protein
MIIHVELGDPIPSLIQKMSRQPNLWPDSSGSGSRPKL